MAATPQSPFTIRRKPLPGHAYAAVPQQSPSTSVAIAPSSVCALDRTCTCKGDCSGCASSLRRGQAAPLLSSDLDEAFMSGALPQSPNEDATPGRQPNGSFLEDHAMHATLSVKPRLEYNKIEDDTWTPFWLHSAVILAFCALFLSLLVALILLYDFARKNNGISTQLSSNHYYWTYGPTSVLMAVVALWRQVDYTCRRLTPWKELGAQQADVQKGLLLDYVSPFLTTSLLRAIKYRHWPVVTSLVGFMLLKLITIFSTGLLVLSSTQLFLDHAHLQTSSTISAKSYCTYLTGCNYSYPSVDSVLNYHGILNNGLPYPDGTTSTSLFELVDLTAAIPEGAVVTTTVPGFYPSFGCKVATVHNNSGFPPREGGFNSFAGSLDPVYSLPFDISIGNKTYSVSDGEILFCNPMLSRCPPRVVTTFDLATTWYDPGDRPTDNLWLLVVNDVRYNQTIAPIVNQTALPWDGDGTPDTINVTEWSAHLETTTAVLCDAYYSIEDTRLRIDTAQKGTDHYLQVTGPLTHTGDHLDGYTNEDLSEDFILLMAEAIPSAFPGAGNQASMFDLMSKLDVVRDDSSYLDANVLVNVSSRAFDMIATQMAFQALQTAGKRNLTGTIAYFEDRLHVKPLSFWAMVAGFAIMIGLTLLILAAKVQAPLPRDPGSIASCATILTASPGLNRQLSTLGSASDGALRHKVSSYAYKTTISASIDPRRSLAASSTMDDDSKELKNHSTTSSSERWQPFAASRTFKAASAVALCATITALAIIQHVSDTNDGITNVELSSTVTHSLSTYVPAAFMLLLATLCSSAAFAIIIMSPYQQLRRGRGKAERTVLVDISGKLPIVVMFTSLQRALLGPFFISVAAFLSSFLTIVVSGLYTANPVPLPRLVTVNQIDYFNTGWNSSGTDNDAMAMLNVLEHKNASYPRFTYGELAIPAIEVGADQETVSDALSHNGDVSLIVSMPVMRASLNCTLIPKTQFGVVENPYTDTGSCEYLSCGLGVPGNVPNSTFDVQAGPASYCNLPGIPNELKNLDYSLQMVYADQNTYSGGIQGLPGCPSLAFMLGYFTTNTSLEYPHSDTTNKENVTTFVCSQYLEESDTEVHFLLPSLSLDATQSPVFNESNSRIVSTEQYDIIDHLGQLSIYPNYSPSEDPNDTDMMSIDTFMQLILSGTEGISANELIHPAETERLIDAVQHMYRKYMAQAINANMRQSFTSASSRTSTSADVTVTAAPKALNATLLDPTRMRVVQNKPSAIVLEVLLGLILLLGIAAYSTTRLRNTLTHNPCSIAGLMSLLAGSALCSREAGLLPEGAEFMTKQELEAVFKRWRFSLGWWDEDGEVVGGQGKGEGGGTRFGIDVDTWKEKTGEGGGGGDG